MKSFLIFFIGLAYCKISNIHSSLITKLEPKMHQLSVKMARSLSPDKNSEISNYIFSTFAEPAMNSFAEMISLNIPNLDQKSFLQKIKYAKDLSVKLESEYRKHLQESLNHWIQSHQKIHFSLNKRQAALNVKPKKRMNTWGIFRINNQGNYIAGLIFSLVTMPIWMEALTSSWGGMVAYSIWSQVFFQPVWNRITFGRWI